MHGASVVGENGVANRQNNTEFAEGGFSSQVVDAGGSDGGNARDQRGSDFISERRFGRAAGDQPGAVLALIQKDRGVDEAFGGPSFGGTVLRSGIQRDDWARKINRQASKELFLFFIRHGDARRRGRGVAAKLGD